MKVVIFGASGATGQHLVQKALDQDHEVTAFVRSRGKLALQHPRLTIIEGNVKDHDIVHKAITGQHAVLSALGASSIFKLDQLIIDGMANILDAMASCAVRRLVYLSTLGVEESRRSAGFMIRNLAPTIIRNEIKGHELREIMIRKSESSWTIVRAPILTNGPFTGKYRCGESLKSDSFMTSLSRADVADLMLLQLTDQRFKRKSISLMPSN
ncbi:NAD(P)H-binding protein [Dyadobacter sp. CY107]|uniref:NAD(P)-dependent oxidoreductase n=1 Tax=Dyadobacter fanqingshengii TaxID=2906443 RepID=UPI001F3A0BAC|nr:NAD(P)H-binding protein [Dyadobacter fanqingshengii]MCF2502020.1 NAD(P)H-binding protein [Dyadobacter fanqingshengii]